jgi:hypothetical protein
MFDPIVVWFGVAVLSGSLALIIAAWTHHARLARFGALVGITSMIVVGYLCIGEPWLDHWGATSGEISTQSSWRHTTRAISIAAPAERVWRLLVLEQSCEPCVTRHVLPGRELVQRCRHATRAFVVVRRSPVTSRLITHTTTAGREPLMTRAYDRVVGAPARFVRERRQLQHLRRRAEGRRLRTGDDVADALPWFLALGLATLSALGALVTRRGWGWVGVFAVSATALLVLPLAHPPVLLGFLWTLGTLAVMSVIARGPPDHEPRF